MCIFVSVLVYDVQMINLFCFWRLCKVLASIEHTNSLFKKFYECCRCPVPLSRGDQLKQEMLEHGMPLDVVGRTVTSGFLTAHLLKYSELLEGEMQ